MNARWLALPAILLVASACGEDACPGRRQTAFRDFDLDGYGDPAHAERVCPGTAGFVDNDQDCDDTRGTTFPGAEERCDGRDQDCDGIIDEDGINPAAWYADQDGDGYGAGASTLACDPPADGMVDRGDDCDDFDPDRHPNADEPFCSTTDHNCDGQPPRPIARPDGTRYRHLPDAIADALDGETVRLCPGRYDSPVVISTNLAIEGVTGLPEDVVIEIGERPISVRAGRFTASGVTFRGDGVVRDVGAGIAVIRTARLTLDHCIVEGGASERGVGGISWDGDRPVDGPEVAIRDTRFVGNRGLTAGALQLWNAVPYTAVLERLKVEDNHGASGSGGLVVASSSQEERLLEVIVRDSTFQANTSENGNGGALDVGGHGRLWVTLEDSTFADNEARAAGAIDIGSSNTSRTTFARVGFSGNHAWQGASALQIGSNDAETIDLEDVTFERNTRESPHHHTIRLGGHGKATMSLNRVTLQHNAGGLEVAETLQPHEVTLTDCIFEDTESSALIAGDTPLAVVRGRFHRNGGAIETGSDLTLDAVDLGSGEDDNVAFDLSVQRAESRWDGVTTLTCVSGRCRP